MSPTRRERLVICAVAAGLLATACSGAQLPASDRASASQQQAGAGQGLAPATGPGPTGSASATPARSGAAAGGAVHAAGSGATTGSAAAGAAAVSSGRVGSTSQSAGTVQYGPGLWSGAADTRGITPTSLTLCGHAALTYANAFDTSPDDLNVYWTATNAAGGVFGRRVDMSWEDDAYDPTQAVTAAKTCESKGIFMLLGGIGFDQIPNVRNWAEGAHELYLHHVATVEGSDRLKYSFTGLPTVEKLGVAFGELAQKRFAGKRIGILHRNSEYWDPGYKAFMAYAQAHGINVVKSIGVENKQANYIQELAQLKAAGADVVWAWENALAITEMVKQANGQQWYPSWMVFPFNLTTQTIGADAIGKMVGIAAWPAYSCHDTSGPFASYASTIKEFEADYAKYDSKAKICGLGGDLLFLNWIEQKALHEMFLACGKDCTRNKFAGLMLNHYKADNVPGHCPEYFTDGHHGSDWVDVFEPYRAPDGNINWHPVQKCVEHIS